MSFTRGCSAKIKTVKSRDNIKLTNFFIIVNNIGRIAENQDCWYSRPMLEEIKLPIEQLREDIMNVWGRL